MKFAEEKYVEETEELIAKLKSSRKTLFMVLFNDIIWIIPEVRANNPRIYFDSARASVSTWFNLRDAEKRVGRAKIAMMARQLEIQLRCHNASRVSQNA